MAIEVRIGDYVSIKESVIDKKVQELLVAGKNKPALRWDSYRNLNFQIIGIDADNLIILRDADENEIHISRKALEKRN